LGLLVFCATAGAGLGRAQSATYSVIPIALPAGWTSAYATAINNSGQFVGYLQNSSAQQQAFFGTAAGITPIPLPPGWPTPIPLPAGWPTSTARGINNSGQIVGNVSQNVTGQPQVFFGTVAGITPIPLPAGWMGSNAEGVNNLGQFVGVGDTNAVVSQPFIGSAAGLTSIPLPAGWAAAVATGINDYGQITGYVDNYPPYASQAVIGTAAGLTPIALPAGLAWALATRINNSGQIIGYGWNGQAEQAFTGTATGITPIPLPKGWVSSTALGINNLGQVVGYIEDASDTMQAFIGNAAGTEPIPVPMGWTLSAAFAINDSGQIVAAGANSSTGFSGIVILTPAPVTGIDLSQAPSYWTPLLTMLTDASNAQYPQGAPNDSVTNPIGPLQFVIAPAYAGVGGTPYPANQILSTYQSAAQALGL